jgi:hypothetical protein
MDSLTLTLLLLLNTPEGTSAVTTDLTAKIDAVLEAPEAAMIGELEQAIREIEARPQQVIADNELADELLRARVVLAWAQQDPERAAAAVDEAIRSAAGRGLPVKGLGMEIKELAKQRAAVLWGEGIANIEVHCAVPCQVIVNERRTVNPTDPLPLGTYRVWVVANNGEIEPMQANVVLDAAGETERIEFGGLEGPAPAEKEWSKRRRAGNAGEPNAVGSKPLLPLWAEIVGVVAGAGLLATGVGLLAIDERCVNGGDPPCQELENTVQGGALVGVGAAALGSFGTILGMDQARVGRGRGAAAMVSWTFRF